MTYPISDETTALWVLRSSTVMSVVGSSNFSQQSRQYMHVNCMWLMNHENCFGEECVVSVEETRMKNGILNWKGGQRNRYIRTYMCLDKGKLDRKQDNNAQMFAIKTRAGIGTIDDSSWNPLVIVRSFPKKYLQGFCLSTTHIPPASQNGREAQHARAMDRNLVNLFSEMTVILCWNLHSVETTVCFEVWGYPLV